MKIKAPGGICIECLEDPENVIVSHGGNVVSAYCCHNQTGGIAYVTRSCGVAWHLLTPITREGWMADRDGNELLGERMPAGGGPAH
jgi:hypothetical protein